MTQMKNKHLIILLCICFPFLSGCNESDDVADIFLGKTWKLTNVFTGPTHYATDYWEDEESKKVSEALLEESGNFTVTFNSTIIDGEEVSGSYNGRAASRTIAGDWYANGKSNAFETSGETSPTESLDILEQVFVYALIHAYKYNGDTNGNLRIYFNDPIKGGTRFLLFKAN